MDGTKESYTLAIKKKKITVFVTGFCQISIKFIEYYAFAFEYRKLTDSSIPAIISLSWFFYEFLQKKKKSCVFGIVSS